jgi:MOSC domain-containing protein YiiM
MGRVEHIHISGAAGGPMQSLLEVEAVRGVGLLGDRYAGGGGTWDDPEPGRDLTLVEAESLKLLAELHGIQLEPGETRRNLTTRGIALNDLVDKHFWIGEVLARGIRLCEPCQYLTDLIGKPILRPLVRRGGLRAQLVTSGRIKVGDRVQLADEPAEILSIPTTG